RTALYEHCGYTKPRHRARVITSARHGSEPEPATSRSHPPQGRADHCAGWTPFDCPAERSNPPQIAGVVLWRHGFAQFRARRRSPEPTSARPHVTLHTHRHVRPPSGEEAVPAGRAAETGIDVVWAT